MDKEKAYFVLVSEKPSVHGKPGAIVEQTLKLAASGLASLVTRTARQRKTGRSYHEAKLANIGEEKAELLLSLTDRVKQKKEGIAGTGSYRPRELRLLLGSRRAFMWISPALGKWI